MSVLHLLACLRPAVEATPPQTETLEAEIGTPAAPIAPAEAPETPPRTPPELYDSVLCPDGHHAVGGWVAGISQPSIVLAQSLKVPMRTDFCAAEADAECTLAPQSFTPGGYTGMEGLVTLVQVPAGRVNIHWVGEGGCLLWQDGHAVLNIDDCPQNPDEVSFESDVALLAATCTDGRQGWFSDNDLLDAGATQEE